jgi:hypothetical protein
MKQASLIATSGATISGDYRYSLWRIWEPEQPRTLFIMLNPSTADQAQDDATIRRCIHFARAFQTGSLEVVNLYAFRATDPARLAQATDATGPENNAHIEQAAARAALIVCAWGAHKQAQGRNREVLALLEKSKNLYCLGVTRGGHPRHPLYIPACVQLERYQAPIVATT